MAKKKVRCPSCGKKLACNAKERIASEKFDLVVLDLMEMPLDPEVAKHAESILTEAIRHAEKSEKLYGKLRKRLLDLL